jgi:hypothetical protein
MTGDVLSDISRPVSPKREVNDVYTDDRREGLLDQGAAWEARTDAMRGAAFVRDLIATNDFGAPAICPSKNLALSIFQNAV